MKRVPSTLALVAVATTAAFLLMCSPGVEAWSQYDDVKVIHVGGKVKCQDCSKGWKDWSDGKPIKGARVAVTCMDGRRRVTYHASDETDTQGEFDLPVRRYSGYSSKEIHPRDCLVRLVSSPDPACGVMTNFGGGRAGVRPYRPTVMLPGVVKYVVGPFFFTTPMCEDPEA